MRELAMAPITTWAQDSCGNYSLHINQKNLSFKESLIGTLLWSNEKQHWRIVLRDNSEKDKFSSISSARESLTNAYSAALQKKSNVY